MSKPVQRTVNDQTVNSLESKNSGNDLNQMSNSGSSTGASILLAKPSSPSNMSGKSESVLTGTAAVDEVDVKSFSSKNDGGGPSIVLSSESVDSFQDAVSSPVDETKQLPSESCPQQTMPSKPHPLESQVDDAALSTEKSSTNTARVMTYRLNSDGSAIFEEEELSQPIANRSQLVAGSEPQQKGEPRNNGTNEFKDKPSNLVTNNTSQPVVGINGAYKLPSANKATAMVEKRTSSNEVKPAVSKGTETIKQTPQLGKKTAPISCGGDAQKTNVTTSIQQPISIDQLLAGNVERPFQTSDNSLEETALRYDDDNGLRGMTAGDDSGDAEQKVTWTAGDIVESAEKEREAEGLAITVARASDDDGSESTVPVGKKVVAGGGGPAATTTSTATTTRLGNIGAVHFHKKRSDDDDDLLFEMSPISFKPAENVSGADQKSTRGTSELRKRSFDIDKHAEIPDVLTAAVKKSAKQASSNDSSGDVPSGGKGASARHQLSQSSGADKRKKGPMWYNMLSPNYKSRKEEFKRIFQSLSNEKLIVDYSCALQKDILVHGRIYITQNWVCFYATIFKWETILTIPCKDITSMTKERTARVIPNAIQICTKDERHFFTSFSTRDKTYMMLFRVWQNALCDQQMLPTEFWQWVHHCYGDELGLTSSDEEGVSRSHDEFTFHEKLHGVNAASGQLDKNDMGRRSDPELPMADSSSSMAVDGVSMATEELDDDRHHGYDRLETSSTSLVTALGPRSLQVPSLDVTTPPDLLTDQGDTTEDEEGEIACEGHEHNGMLLIDDVFPISVNKVFDYIFSDCQFSQDVTKARKITDFVHTPWPEQTDGDGNKMRTLTYTVWLNYSIGPKTSPVTEKQIWRPESKPGYSYIIDSECQNAGIPYGEHFYVFNRYCLTAISANNCRLKVHSEIKYRKSVWGLVKNFIDKNATQGLTENFHILRDYLRTECTQQVAQMVMAQIPAGKKKVLKRRRQLSHGHPDRISQKVAPSEGSTPQGGVTFIPAKTKVLMEKCQITFSKDVLVKTLYMVLILLVLFNAMLFYKLWSLEALAHSIQKEMIDNTIYSEQPSSQEEWARLLSKQRYLHETEMIRWKEVLSLSIELVGQMQQSLGELRKSVETRSTMMKNLDDTVREKVSVV